MTLESQGVLPTNSGPTSRRSPPTVHATPHVKPGGRRGPLWSGSRVVFQGHFTAPARRLRAEPRRPEADGDARTRFVPSDGRARTPTGRTPRHRDREGRRHAGRTDVPTSRLAARSAASDVRDPAHEPDGGDAAMTARRSEGRGRDASALESEADQLASESDQRQAVRDQNASDRDQVMADWAHAHAPAAALTDQAHQTSRMEREAASRERDSTAAIRSATSLSLIHI